jgi:putative NADH-flavin reductase
LNGLIALLDEVELPQFIPSRMTVAYGVAAG